MLTIDSLPAEAVATFQKEDDINIQETYEMVLEDREYPIFQVWNGIH